MCPARGHQPRSQGETDGRLGGTERWYQLPLPLPALGLQSNFKVHLSKGVNNVPQETESLQNPSDATPGLYGKAEAASAVTCVSTGPSMIGCARGRVRQAHLFPCMCPGSSQRGMWGTTPFRPLGPTRGSRTSPAPCLPSRARPRRQGLVTCPGGGSPR